MVMYVVVALAGIGFGLLQAWWTARMVSAQEQKGRSALVLVGKLALWALIMVALALYNPVYLVIFALCAGSAMVFSSIVLWRKTRSVSEDHHTGGHQA